METLFFWELNEQLRCLVYDALGSHVSLELDNIFAGGRDLSFIELIEEFLSVILKSFFFGKKSFIRKLKILFEWMHPEGELLAAFL